MGVLRAGHGMLESVQVRSVLTKHIDMAADSWECVCHSNRGVICAPSAPLFSLLWKIS